MNTAMAVTTLQMQQQGVETLAMRAKKACMMCNTAQCMACATLLHIAVGWLARVMTLLLLLLLLLLFCKHPRG
jgi:hypothetical protein